MDGTPQPQQDPWGVAGQSAPATPTQAPAPKGNDPWGVAAVSAPQPSGSPQAGAPAQPKSDEIQVDPHSGSLSNLMHAGGALLEGGGEGIFSTLAGGADLVNKVGAHVFHTDPNNPIVPQAATKELHTLAGDNNAEHGGIQQVGKIGESIAEFMLGDEALKGLSLPEKIKAIAPAMKAIEKSPTLSKVVGALAAGGRAATVQGAQTVVRTGGDVGQAAEDAAKMGGVTAALGGAGAVASEALGKMGAAASKAKNLSALAEGAASKPEVAQQLADRIEQAKSTLHGNYEAGVQDIAQRLDGQTISAQDNPLAEKAKQVLSDPGQGADNSELHPMVSDTKRDIGDQLNPVVKKRLERLANGQVPGGPKGKDLVASPDYGADDLITLRQDLRKLANGYDYRDVNARAIRQVLPAIDDTIGKLAEQSGDADAVSDYANLRGNYSSKINLFDDPVIRKIRDGNVNDAAKDFVGVLRQGSALPSTGKTDANIATLKGILGDDGLKAFGRDVFGTMLKDSITGAVDGEGGTFNPARFVDTWKRITPETKNALFDSEIAGRGLKMLAADAGDAAKLQHLTRAGILVGAGSTIGHTVGPIMTGLGGLIGFVVGESGSLTKGRQLLDYVATHPKAWSAYEGVGKAATSDAGRAAGSAVLKGAQAGVNATSGASRQSDDQPATQ